MSLLAAAQRVRRISTGESEVLDLSTRGIVTMDELNQLVGPDPDRYYCIRVTLEQVYYWQSLMRYSPLLTGFLGVPFEIVG
jgi:hypothetical protein